jgi:hypothetical protein
VLTMIKSNAIWQIPVMPPPKNTVLAATTTVSATTTLASTTMQDVERGRRSFRFFCSQFGRSSFALSRSAHRSLTSATTTAMWTPMEQAKLTAEK